MSETMTPKLDDDQKPSMALPEGHVVSSSSSSEDASHELPDLRITALLSAAAHLAPLKAITEEDSSPKAAPHSVPDMNEQQSTSHKRKRNAEKSTLYDPDLLAAIFRVQPSEAELEAANTERTKGALLSWYDRLRELHMFKAKYGHAEVPQQYPENHALGIVS